MKDEYHNMKDEYHKWFSNFELADINDKDPILFVITKNWVQDIAVLRLGRELSKIEIGEIKDIFGFFGDENVSDHVIEAINEAIDVLMEEEKNEKRG